MIQPATATPTYPCQPKNFILADVFPNFSIITLVVPVPMANPVDATKAPCPHFFSALARTGLLFFTHLPHGHEKGFHHGSATMP